MYSIIKIDQLVIKITSKYFDQMGVDRTSFAYKFGEHRLST